jgi:hypothetical protein
LKKKKREEEEKKKEEKETGIIVIELEMTIQTIKLGAVSHNLISP